MVATQLDSEIFFTLSVAGLQFLGVTYDVTIDEGGYVLRAVKDMDIIFVEHCGHTQTEVLENFKREVTQAAIESMLGYSSRLDFDWSVKELKNGQE